MDDVPASPAAARLRRRLLCAFCAKGPGLRPKLGRFAQNAVLCVAIAIDEMSESDR
jgi:hypothetical protein